MLARLRGNGITRPMDVVNAQLLPDGTCAVLLTGPGIDRLPANPGLPERQLKQPQLRLRCAGQSWAVLKAEHPAAQGGVPVASVLLRGPTRPREGMVLRLSTDPLSVEEADSFVEALVHFWRITRSVNGELLGDALDRYRTKVQQTSTNPKTDPLLRGVGEFLGLAALANMVNNHFDLLPGMEGELGDWRELAAKVRSVLLDR